MIASFAPQGEEAPSADCELSAPARLDFQSCRKSQTAHAGIRLTPAFQSRSTSLRFAVALDLSASPARWPLRFAPFHATETPETGK
jgi:hypothetical protein